ncbi:MAG: UbiX family flavin prenyltransferase [Lachnospiraceae bacterium]|jgi:4-hydroxy-3-polyprenylbenzoate decarboxylase
MKRRIIVGISGASGIPVAVEVLRQLKNMSDIETHLVYTESAERTITFETELSLMQIRGLADIVYDNSNIGAGPASGTFRTLGMVVVPCSMKTLAGIVSGYSDNLLLRAADVTLKERRRLVLVTRECPFGTLHLRNMYEASQLGAVILPPVLSYYNNPGSIEDCTRHIAGKILDQFDLEPEGMKRWS